MPGPAQLNVRYEVALGALRQTPLHIMIRAMSVATLSIGASACHDNLCIIDPAGGTPTTEKGTELFSRCACPTTCDSGIMASILDIYMLSDGSGMPTTAQLLKWGTVKATWTADGEPTMEPCIGCITSATWTPVDCSQPIPAACTTAGVGASTETVAGGGGTVSQPGMAALGMTIKECCGCPTQWPAVLTATKTCGYPDGYDRTGSNLEKTAACSAAPPLCRSLLVCGLGSTYGTTDTSDDGKFCAAEPDPFCPAAPPPPPPAAEADTIIGIILSFTSAVLYALGLCIQRAALSLDQASEAGSGGEEITQASPGCNGRCCHKCKLLNWLIGLLIYGIGGLGLGTLALSYISLATTSSLFSSTMVSALSLV